MDATTEALLIETFQEAAKAAQEAGRDEEDGGASNFDAPAFRIERVADATIERLAIQAGLRVDKFTWLGRKRWFWLGTPTFGQGNRRSRMSQAAHDVLARLNGKVPGFHAVHYQQMD